MMKRKWLPRNPLITNKLNPIHNKSYPIINNKKGLNIKGKPIINEGVNMTINNMTKDKLIKGDDQW